MLRMVSIAKNTYLASPSNYDKCSNNQSRTMYSPENKSTTGAIISKHYKPVGDRAPGSNATAQVGHAVVLSDDNMGAAQLDQESGMQFGFEPTLQQYAIKVIRADGQTKLLSDAAGVLIFDSRDHAERMTWRLAYCNSGDLYEVTELSR
jgi:hypothetical protein